MEKKCLFMTLALGLSLTLALLRILGSPSSSVVAAPSVGHVEAPNTPAAELHVCSAGPPTCDYSSVQTAVDAASPGGVVKVAAGIYTDVSVRPRDDLTATGIVTQVIYISRTVTLQGGYTTTNWTTPDPDANPTTLDARGQGRVLYIIGDISPTVEGLRITGGNAAGLGGDWWGDDAGGGAYVITATATINNNWVYSNSAGAGAGLYLYRSDATISKNMIYNNTAFSGGGMMSTYSDATVDGNTFSNNSGPEGGGLHLHGGDGAMVLNNIIVSNTGYLGGGVYLYNADATLTNNIIANNQVTGLGSAILFEQCFPHLAHTTIARNIGGDGSGIHVRYDSNVASFNTILVSHTVGITVTAGSTATLEATLWGTEVWANEDDWGGAGTVITGTSAYNYWDEPAFLNPDGGNYHIGLGSAAIDAGVDAGVTVDIDGESRPAGAGYDIGADEFFGKVYLPLVLRQ